MSFLVPRNMWMSYCRTSWSRLLKMLKLSNGICQHIILHFLACRCEQVLYWRCFAQMTFFNMQRLVGHADCEKKVMKWGNGFYDHSHTRGELQDTGFSKCWWKAAVDNGINIFPQIIALHLHLSTFRLCECLYIYKDCARDPCKL